MLHGKHVMVRVGGGWDTLKGFLLKYDPGRVLQFTTLEQKILAYHKGPALSAQTAQPPAMDPIAAVNLLPESSSSSSTSSKPNTPASGHATPRGYAQSPASTPSLPRKAAAPKKILQMPTPSPKTTPLPSPVLKRTPLLQSQKPPAQSSKTKLRPRGSPSQPRSPVCPEPNCKLPKPSAPPSAHRSARTPLPQKPFQRDARPPPGPARSRLAQRRPASPASSLQLDSRQGRPVSPRLARPTRVPNDPKQTISTPRAPSPLTKSKSKSVTQNAGGTTRTVPAKTAPHRKPLSSSNPPSESSTTTRPAPAVTTRKHTTRTKPSKPEEPYFEMNNKRRLKN